MTSILPRDVAERILAAAPKGGSVDVEYYATPQNRIVFPPMADLYIPKEIFDRIKAAAKKIP